MRSNRGLSEFASFPLLLIVALVIIIISILMYAAEFSNETSSIDSGIQAATVGLLHAERDQVEAYLRTALDRSVRDGIARAYAYRSLACPISEQGLPIISDSCGYGYDAFVSSSERFATNRFSQVASDHPSAVLMDAQVTIDDRARGEIRSALVFHETGSGSRIYEISRDIESSELPIFLGSLEAFDHVPGTITSEPEIDFDSDTLPYCAADPMSEEKAATFVRNTIEYCERLSGTCSCGSVPLPEGVKPEIREDGVYLYEYPLGIDTADLEDAPWWRFWADSLPVNQLYIHRNDSGVILNATNPSLSSCVEADLSASIVSTSLSHPIPSSVDLGALERTVLPQTDEVIAFDTDVVVILSPNEPINAMRYYGDEDLIELHDLAMRALSDVYGSMREPDELTPGPIATCDGDYLINAATPRSLIDPDDAGLEAIDSLYDLEGKRLLYIQYPLRIAPECGSLEFGPGSERYTRLMQSIATAADQAVDAVSSRPRTRIVCIDDPIEEWVEINGEQQYASVYPTIAVPLTQDFVWPLEDIGRLTQCWGPPAASWTDAPYSFHRGIDLQPSPYGFEARKYPGTPFEHYPDGRVVAIADGKVVGGALCGLSVFPEDYPKRSYPYSIQEAGEEGVLAALSTPSYSGLVMAEEHCGPSLGGGFGEHLVIGHDGQYAIYAHLAPGSVAKFFSERDGTDKSLIPNELIAKKLEVQSGDVIGLVGNSGTSTGAHLHFEVYPAGDGVNDVTQRPVSRVYAPPATDFTQFNPFCILSKDVLREDGTTYDISERMPGGTFYDSTVPATSAFEDDGSVTGFDRPATIADQCSYNYLMAYYNHNPDPNTYGVCPFS